MEILDKEVVEQKLGKFINSVTDIAPSINEIRVFGSFNNGNWNPEKSDVDLYIETETFQPQDYYNILDKKKICRKFHVTVLSAKRRFTLENRNSNLIQQIKKGKLLYSKSEQN